MSPAPTCFPKKLGTRKMIKHAANPSRDCQMLNAIAPVNPNTAERIRIESTSSLGITRCLASIYNTQAETNSSRMKYSPRNEIPARQPITPPIRTRPANNIQKCFFSISGANPRCLSSSPLTNLTRNVRAAPIAAPSAMPPMSGNNSCIPISSSVPVIRVYSTAAMKHGLLLLYHFYYMIASVFERPIHSP